MEGFKRPSVSINSESTDAGPVRPVNDPTGSSHSHVGKGSPAQSPSQTKPPFPAAMSSRVHAADDGITGKPFIRASSPSHAAASSSCSAHIPRAPASPAAPRSDHPAERSQQQRAADQVPAGTRPPTHGTSADVVVGFSRLHMVSLPALRMQPIYWSPVNDNAVAMRGTWFYRYDFLPPGLGAPTVANLNPGTLCFPCPQQSRTSSRLDTKNSAPGLRRGMTS